MYLGYYLTGKQYFMITMVTALALVGPLSLIGQTGLTCGRHNNSFPYFRNKSLIPIGRPFYH